MQRYFRPLLTLLMALTLVVTAQSMASARNMTTPTGEMVLCTGTGPVSIEVDAEGNPTGPVHICPDCSISLFDVALASPELAGFVDWGSMDYRTAPFRWALRLSGPEPSARAPPISDLMLQNLNI